MTQFTGEFVTSLKLFLEELHPEIEIWEMLTSTTKTFKVRGLIGELEEVFIHLSKVEEDYWMAIIEY